MQELRIIYVSTFPPRECGIATFTKDLIETISTINPNIAQGVIAMQEKNAPKRCYSNLIKYEISQEEPESYYKAANYINRSGANIACIQHEYGIFGGFDGVLLLDLLKKIKIPIVSFLHSVPTNKESKRINNRLDILKEIGKYSKYINTFILSGKKTINELGISEKKINNFYHPGPFISPSARKEKNKIKKIYNLSGKFIISSQGLINYNKGLEYGIEAIGKLKKEYPNIVYLILGKSHPVNKNMTSPRNRDYYLNLQKQVSKLKLSKNVKFINHFLTKKEMLDFAKITDIYLFPYLRKEQISSGILSYALSTGNCIVSTPFFYAKDILKEKRGKFIDFKSSDSIVKSISGLINHPKEMQSIRKKAYEFGKKISWPEMGKKYIEIFEKAVKK